MCLQKQALLFFDVELGLFDVKLKPMNAHTDEGILRIHVTPQARAAQ
jgi:hypothetical protein